MPEETHFGSEVGHRQTGRGGGEEGERRKEIGGREEDEEERERIRKK